ncbi:MAG TPA: MFS transporter [Bauldia sp.]|nr:MFS transporter [Bauldia sp.]
MTRNEAAATGYSTSQELTVAVAIAAFAAAVIVTTEFIVVGILPALARELALAVAEAGHFVSWYAIAAALGGPPLTILFSRTPPHRVLAAVLLIFAVGNLAIVLAPGYALIAAVRILQGAVLPLFVATATAAVARIAPPGRAGRAIAGVNVGVVVGTVFAVPAGVLLADLVGWSATFMVLAVLAALAMLIVAALFPRLDNAGLAGVADQAAILLRPTFQAHLALSAILFVGMFAAYTYLAAYLESVAGLRGAEIAPVLMGFGLAGLVGNWAAGRVVDRAPVAATGCVAAILSLALATLSVVSANLVTLLTILAVWGAAHTAAFILCHVRTMLAAPEATAFAGSLNISVSNLGVAAGAVVGGWTIERFGLEAIGWGGALFTGVAVLIALALARAQAGGR